MHERRPTATSMLQCACKKAKYVGSRSNLSVDAVLAEELSALSKKRRCPPLKRATDDAIRDYLARQKNRSEQQWWEETSRRLEGVNHVRADDDIDAREMFEVVRTLLQKEFGRVAEFRAPNLFTGGKLRARPVYMTAGAGVDLFELWRAVFTKKAFRANAALDKLGDFVMRLNTGVMPQPDAHDGSAEGLTSLRVPYLPALTVLFVHIRAASSLCGWSILAFGAMARYRQSSAAGRRKSPDPTH